MSRGLLYHSMWEYINHVIDCDAINVQINNVWAQPLDREAGKT